ncbi:MAG: aminotransferase class III-fold pyridoxal phosphate-dependent enzyme, partial [Blastocatellia bacterium]
MSSADFQGPAHLGRHDRIVSQLKDIVSELTGMSIDSVDASANYLELGVDSLLLIALSRAIQQKFEIRLSLVQLIEEFSSIDSVAAHIGRETIEKNLEDRTGSIDHDQSQSPVTKQQVPADMVPDQTDEFRIGAAANQTKRGTTAPKDIFARENGSQSRAGEISPDTQKARPSEESLSLLRQKTGPSEAGAHTLYSVGAVERVIQEQLRVMARQLNILGARSEFKPAQVSHPVPLDVSHETAESGEGAAQTGRSTSDTTRQESDANKPGYGQVARPGPAGIVPEVFVPFRPYQTARQSGLSPRQERYLAEFITRYNSRTRESKRQAQEYRLHLADSRNSVGFRRPLKELLYQIVGKASSGSRLWDVDGNEYVDITMGFGVHLFGHSPSFLNRALGEQLDTGVQLGPQTELAGRAAKLVCELTGMERASFCNSGTEAVMAAMRAARTFTGRDKIVIFSGGYHGWSDGTLAKADHRPGRSQSIPLVPGVPRTAVQDLVVLEFDNTRSLEIIKNLGSELAAVLV